MDCDREEVGDDVVNDGEQGAEVMSVCKAEKVVGLKSGRSDCHTPVTTLPHLEMEACL